MAIRRWYTRGLLKTIAKQWLTLQVKDGKLTPRSLNKESTQKSEEKKDELSASQASDVAKEGEGENSVSLFSLRCSYVEKQASVIVVDVADLGRYN